jgi:UDP-N-acetylglucosamine 1-carboxyvinyltransferase
MEKIVIEGGCPLQGTVEISGSKNAALPILAASLLTDSPLHLKRVPNLLDIQTMFEILKELGIQSEYQGQVAELTPVSQENSCASYELVRQMRASIAVLGPLLAKRGRAKVSLPGGCVIGVRPIDLHLKGLRALGAKIKVEHGYVVAEADELRGAEIYLGGAFGASVLGTANVMMAATLAKGTTILECAACEPEIEDLAEVLVKMGAKIKGAGTHRIQIEGVSQLHGAEHTIIPDRIEAGTFLMAAAMTRGSITVEGVQPRHILCLLDKLEEMGLSLSRSAQSISINASSRSQSADVCTYPFPGFPTDLQAQFVALLSISDGTATVTERVYPDRFMHIAELSRMGAQIQKDGASVFIQGVPSLYGAPVMASDLRASAALVMAGLFAQGRTDIHRIYHIDRGYEKIEAKLNALGARVWREKE